MKRKLILIALCIAVTVAIGVALVKRNVEPPSATVEYLAGADGIYALRVHFRNYDQPFTWAFYISETADVDGVDTEVAKYPVCDSVSPVEMTSLSVLLYQSFKRNKEETASNPNFKFRFHYTIKGGFGTTRTGVEALDGITLPATVKTSMDIIWTQEETVITGNRVKIGTVITDDRRYDIIVETSFQQDAQADGEDAAA